MSLMTTWGYTLTDADTLPDMLGTEAFDQFTAGKYTGDERTEGNLRAAEAAIRNYCGWHVAPALPCKLTMTFFDKRVATVGGGVLIQLPATFVSEVLSVKVGDVEVTGFVLESNGVLRIYSMDWHGVRQYTPIEVEYVAGVPLEMLTGVQELIAHRVTHALASSAGVQSETAGGVSITYNATWTNSARATALADDNKEVLAPYRLRGVF
jgi:hypothetical protein